jgi:hypothetical protein
MQNQKELSVIFLSFKSSHQVHDKQLHHLSKLLDQYFLWVNIRIAMMNKQNKTILKYFVSNAWFLMKM